MITNKRRLERIDMAIELMSKTNKELGISKFDMSRFGEKNACGTAACGIGTLSLQPWFQRRGLRSKWDRGELLPARYGSSEWIDEVVDVFGISRTEAADLVTPGVSELDDGVERPARFTKKHFIRRLRNLRSGYV